MAGKQTPKFNKKLSLRSLSWSNVLKSKSASLDEQDPEAQQMSKPAGINWGVRLDTEEGGQDTKPPTDTI